MLSVLFVIAVYFQYTIPKPINWMENYTKKSEAPYGCFILHDILPELFPKKNISYNQQTLYESLDSLQNFEFLIVNSFFEPDENETKKLLASAHDGNTFFIAAHQFGCLFADTLGIKTNTIYELNYPNFKKELPLAVNFENPHLAKKSPFHFNKNAALNYFSKIDTTHSTSLGFIDVPVVNDGIYQEKYTREINFIEVRFGKGKIYLNTLPLAFTNYFLTDSANYSYPIKALSYLNKKPQLVWDDYYKVGKPIITSPLRFVLSQPALKWAYWLTIIGLLTYILFNIKRRQRIIPIIEPLKNATKDFVGIIAQMYFLEKNHLDLAEKKIAYFYDNIRTNYLLNTQSISDDFKLQLSAKSGVDIDFVNRLFEAVFQIQNKKNITEKELLHLTHLINTFEKNKIR